MHKNCNRFLVSVLGNVPQALDSILNVLNIVRSLLALARCFACFLRVECVSSHSR